MTKFWPERSSVVGFSIEKLAKSYRDKLRMKSTMLTADVVEQELLPRVSFDHWANREFSEYF